MQRDRWVMGKTSQDGAHYCARNIPARRPSGSSEKSKGNRTLQTSHQQHALRTCRERLQCVSGSQCEMQHLKSLWDLQRCGGLTGRFKKKGGIGFLPIPPARHHAFSVGSGPRTRTALALLLCHEGLSLGPVDGILLLQALGLTAIRSRQTAQGFAL